MSDGEQLLLCRTRESATSPEGSVAEAVNAIVPVPLLAAGTEIVVALPPALTVTCEEVGPTGTLVDDGAGVLVGEVDGVVVPPPPQPAIAAAAAMMSEPKNRERTRIRVPPIEKRTDIVGFIRQTGSLPEAAFRS
jgi:hypothetical protein